MVRKKLKDSEHRMIMASRKSPPKRSQDHNMFQIIKEEMDEEDTKDYATFASKGLTLKQYTDGQAHSSSHGKLGGQF